MNLAQQRQRRAPDSKSTSLGLASGVRVRVRARLGLGLGLHTLRVTYLNSSPDPDPSPNPGPSPSPQPNQGQRRPALIAADELLPALQFVLVRAQLRRPHALLSLMEAHVARGAHNTLSQYWVVSLLMALRAIESDCFGSPCTAHNVAGRPS